MNYSKLFVGNVAQSVTQDELERMFAAHGTVIEVKVPLDRESGRPRGFAFVTMATAQDARTAIQALNGQSVGERTITVAEAREREERPAFNRSGNERSQGDNSSGGRRRY